MSSAGRFVSFEAWRSATMATLTDEEMSAKCAECGGDGTSNCDCCGQEVNCTACSGQGYFAYTEQTHPKLTRAMYERAVADDLKKACVFAHWDFLELAGEFTKECREIRV